MKKLLVLLLLSNPAFAITKVKLALNWKAEPEFGGIYAAELTGEFKKRGLEVEILEGGSGTPTVQMLANKTLPFAVVSGDEIVLSQDRNPSSKVVAVFGTYQTSPYMIMSHKSAGLKNLKELFASKGILSVESGLPFYNFLLRKFGKPQIQIAPFAGGISQFLNNPKLSQQGFVTSEPLLARKAGVEVTTFMLADEGFNPYAAVLATQADYLKQNPETVTKLVQALRSGWKAYLKDPTATNLHMSKLNKGMDLESFRQSAEAQKALIETRETNQQGLGTMKAERWEALVRQLSEIKLIKTQPPASDLYKNID